MLREEGANGDGARTAHIAADAQRLTLGTMLDIVGWLVSILLLLAAAGSVLLMLFTLVWLPAAVTVRLWSGAWPAWFKRAGRPLMWAAGYAAMFCGVTALFLFGLRQ
jgi:hypothetical protein